MKKITNEFKKEKSSKLRVYIILRFLVIVCMIRQIFQGNLSNVLLCILTLILFLIPSILSKKLKIEFPDTLEILVYAFIFSAEILGEINEFYIHIPNFDSIIHTINGFIMAGIGLSLVDILNNDPNTKFSLKPIYVVLCAFCFSMTTGAIWEIFEYSMDKIFYMDMQKDTIITEITSVKLNEEGKNKPETIKINSLEVNGEDYMEKYGGYIDIGLNDTMEDLIVNFIGAVIFCGLGYFYLVGRGHTAQKFIITKKTN